MMRLYGAKRLTDNVTDVSRPTFLELRQNVGLKSQRGHTEEEIPDTISWNNKKTDGESLARQKEDETENEKH